MATTAMQTQKGHVYVKFSNHYTATVRNIDDFKTLLADNSEDKSCLEITSIYNVTPAFKAEVKRLIEEFKAPTKQVANKHRLKYVSNNDQQYYKSCLGEQCTVDYWTASIEATCKNAEEVVFTFQDFLEKFDSEITFLGCPDDGYGDGCYYNDSVSIDAYWTSKAEFVKRIKAAIKAFKKA